MHSLFPVLTPLFPPSIPLPFYYPPSLSSSLPPSLPGTMLLESLHLICFYGRPASCAHYLVLEMKAKVAGTLSWVGWLPSWVLPERRICSG